ncbi:MAG: M55 family metallopeptidase [Chloroflexi bacterium]|nr:M55 family metallopeptidase [Chloroflexota bacterium]
MRVIVDTDLEGISGIVCWEQCRDFASAMYQSARGLLMGDVNALVEGLLAAGADDIVVMDGHGGGFNFIPELMHPGARYFTGRGRSPWLAWAELYERADVGILLGYHAMAGTPDAILRHTQSSRGGNRYWYNGRESGELAQDAIIMGSFGIPVIMMSGDSAACREAHAFLGSDITAVEVKKSYGEEFGLLTAPAKAHELIKEGAVHALQNAARCVPYALELPIRGRLRFPDKSTADAYHPSRSTRIDDYTFEATFENARDIYFF